MEQQQGGWPALARAVKERRGDLGMTLADLANRMKIGTRILSEIENARRNSYSSSTLERLEQALGWRPGGVERILAGRDPVPLPTATMSWRTEDLSPAQLIALLAQAHDSVAELLRHVPDEDLLAEIQRRFAARSAAAETEDDEDDEPPEGNGAAACG